MIALQSDAIRNYVDAALNMLHIDMDKTNRGLVNTTSFKVWLCVSAFVGQTFDKCLLLRCWPVSIMNTSFCHRKQ